MKRSEIMAIISDKEKPDKEIIQAIMDLHEVDAELWKAQKKELDDEITGLKNKTTGDDGGGEWKKKYEDEVAAHNSTKSAYAAEKEYADTDGKVAAALKAAGMNEKVIDKALKLYDRTIVKKGKDGNIENADNVVEAFKKDWADFFGEVKTEGATVGNNFQNNAGTKNPWLPANRNLAEQTRIFRENPALARQMAAAAGIKLD